MRKEHEQDKSGSPEEIVFGIWKDFWKSHRGPENIAKRDKALNEYLDSLPQKQADYLTTSKEGSALSPLAEIREKARRRAEEERAKSKSERLHTRRIKAQERRGTDPRKIH